MKTNALIISPKPPKAVRAAIEHVRSVFPTVNMVTFRADGRWLFVDDGNDAPNFDSKPAKINTSILDAAADAVYTGKPSVFEVIEQE